MRSSRSAPDPLEPSWLGFAHRGLHGSGIPENSLAAFRAAASFTSGAECDVRLSRDGVPMVFHDEDLERLCGAPDRLAERDRDWLGGQLLLGTDETIPTLADLLDCWPTHLPLLIECKTGGDGAALAAAVAAVLEPGAHDAGVMSFDPAVSCWLGRHCLGRPRGLVVDSRWPAEFRDAQMAKASPTFLAIDIRLIEDPWTAAMRARFPVYTWTVRSAEQRRTARVHADALIWEADGRP